jgi:hypothetical protein
MPRCCRSADLLQCLPLRFQIGPGVVIGGVETHMTEPAADDRDVNARRDEVHGGGMAEAVRVSGGEDPRASGGRFILVG